MANWMDVVRESYRPPGYDFEHGMDIGQRLVGGIGQALQQYRQNAIANKMMNTMTPPRAALENAGRNPQTGQLNTVPESVSIGGTPPATGGVDEFRVRQLIQQNAIENALKQSQAGYYGAHSAAVIQNAISSARNANTRATAPGGGNTTAHQQWIENYRAQQQDQNQRNAAMKAGVAEQQKGTDTP